MRIRIEFQPRNCWIGVFPRRTVEHRLHRPREGRPFIASRPRLDVWICVLPCLPLHITRFGEETRESLDCASTALERAVAGVDVQALGWIRHEPCEDAPNTND